MVCFPFQLRLCVLWLLLLFLLLLSGDRCFPARPLVQSRRKYCRQRNVNSYRSFPDLGAFVREFSWWISNQARGNNSQQEQSSSMYQVWHSWPAVCCDRKTRTWHLVVKLSLPRKTSVPVGFWGFSLLSAASVKRKGGQRGAWSNPVCSAAVCLPLVSGKSASLNFHIRL